MQFVFYGFFVVLAVLIGWTMWRIEPVREKTRLERRYKQASDDAYAERESWYDTAVGEADIMTWEEELLDSPKG